MVEAAGVELVGEGVAGIAHAGAGGVTALNHARAEDCNVLREDHGARVTLALPPANPRVSFGAAAIVEAVPKEGRGRDR